MGHTAHKWISYTNWLMLTIRGLSMTIRILFEPRDLWVGVYWRTFMEAGNKMLQLYVCILPVFPIQITFPIRKWAGWDAYDKGS
jgi:hypothetical protein